MTEADVTGPTSLTDIRPAPRLDTTTLAGTGNGRVLAQRGIYRQVSALRNPSAKASSSEQNHRYQTAHKAVTMQWQDGKQFIVWPDEVATGKARLPAPIWSLR